LAIRLSPITFKVGDRVYATISPAEGNITCVGTVARITKGHTLIVTGDFRRKGKKLDLTQLTFFDGEVKLRGK